MVSPNGAISRPNLASSSVQTAKIALEMNDRGVLIVLEPSERRLLWPDGDPFPTLDPSANWGDSLVQAAPEVLVGGWSTPRLPDSAILAGGGSIRYYCYVAGSVRDKVTRAQIESGLRVTHWGNAISRTVAEFALLLVLSCLRRTAGWVRILDAGGWKNGTPEQRSLFGRSVGIHGYGNVARELVALLAPFGCTIQIYAPGVPSALPQAPSLVDLFAMNDVVVELEALTPASRNMVGRQELNALRPDSVLVNIGRGAVIEEEALVERALRGDVQFGLDVHAEEPLRADHPLRRLPNVLLTPHMAGPTPDRMCDAGLSLWPTSLATSRASPCTPKSRPLSMTASRESPQSRRYTRTCCWDP